MALTWTDWRGHDYTVGDTILYARMSGRSCEMAEGVVEDLAVYYYENYKWKRLGEGQKVPEKQVWRWKNPETGEPETWNRGGRDGNPDWERIQVWVPLDNERRAKVMPTLRTSRFNSYDARQTKWLYDPATGKGEFIDAGPRKAVTLRVTESITAIVP